jgi:hypothetical protein
LKRLGPAYWNYQNVFLTWDNAAGGALFLIKCGRWSPGLDFFLLRRSPQFALYFPISCNPGSVPFSSPLVPLSFPRVHKYCLWPVLNIATTHASCVQAYFLSLVASWQFGVTVVASGQHHASCGPDSSVQEIFWQDSARPFCCQDCAQA